MTTSFGMLGIVSSHRNGYKWLEITVWIASTQRGFERKSGWINSPKKDQRSAKKTSGFQANSTSSWCLKITEKVSYNSASEASYVYILIRQKFIKNIKNGQFWRLFENLKLAVKQCYQRIGEKCQN